MSGDITSRWVLTRVLYCWWLAGMFGTRMERAEMLMSISRTNQELLDESKKRLANLTKVT